jgi:cell division inhibitor SepF
MASFFKKTMLYLGLGPDEHYESYDDERESDRRETVTPVSRAAGTRPVSPIHEQSGSVRPIRGGGGTASGHAASVATGPEHSEARTPLRGGSTVRPIPRVSSAKPQSLAPASFNEGQEIADRFKANQPVIVNLQGADRDLRRRLIDFCSGLCYGLGGQMERVADHVYLLTPTNVEVSEEDRRRLERGLDD